MIARPACFLVGVAALLSLDASGVEPPKTETTLQRVVARARPEAGLYYSRAIAPEDYSDFRHHFGANLGLGAEIDPTLIAKASLSLDRELGAPVEQFRASNTTLSLTKTADLERFGALKPAVFVKLPTHDEDRTYLSYRGSFGISARFVKERVFTFANVHSVGGALDLTGARNLFAYSHSREGALANRLWTLGGAATAVYTFREKLSLYLFVKNTSYWTWEGAQDIDRYELGGSIEYRAPYDLRLSLKTVTSDRTFQYDQVSWNVNLYKPESTLVVFSVGYAPKFDAL